MSINPRWVWRGNLEDKWGYEHRGWHMRLVEMADYLSAEDKIVMDLGAGNMHLRKILPEGTKYIPVDYRATSSETIVCDLNQYQFPDVKVDAIVAAGIFDYIVDKHWFLDSVTNCADKVIISYEGDNIPASDVIDYLKSRNFVMTARGERQYKNVRLLACFERLTSKKLCKQIACTGCGACANACPNDAIEMKFDDAGFLKPQVNNKCINCGCEFFNQLGR